MKKKKKEGVVKEEESREPVLRFVQNEVADDLGKGSVVGVRGMETRGQAVEKGVLRKGGVRAVHLVGVFKSFTHLRKLPKAKTCACHGLLGQSVPFSSLLFAENSGPSDPGQRR